MRRPSIPEPIGFPKSTPVDTHSDEAKGLLKHAINGGGNGLTQEQALEAAKVHAILALARAVDRLSEKREKSEKR